MNVKDYLKLLIFAIGSFPWIRKKSKIIYYHDIYERIKYTDMGTSLELFKKHLEIAHRLDYEIVDRISSPNKELTIMLDDGFRGIWDCREFFFQNNIHPTIFIAKDLVGKQGYLNESEIKELNSHGWIFQSHTVSHTNLNHFDKLGLDKQLQESKDYLEGLLHHEVNEICAPQGFFSDIVLERTINQGYKLFYSSIPGAYFDTLLNYSYIKRRNLCQFLTPLQFRLVLLGGYNLLTKRYIKKGYQYKQY